MSGNDPQLAIHGAVQKTIPNASVDAAVTTTVSHSNVLRDLSGKWVWLEAVGADITYKRGTHPTMAAGDGLVLSSGDVIDYYIDPGVTTDNVLSLIVASGSAVLRVHYDDLM